ncbi:peptidase S8/S53 subtilisin kexin sedolisin [Mesorhizobium sp. M0036]|uniref:peptidase S8/S53 subtilisin kexin sedolisin n=1 Tax=Mesorhizobium sp. M0036 TaxID=2956853 RepID=UPI00333856E9
MAISGQGWELNVVRLGIHKNGNQRRTYGTYQAYLNNQPIAGLSGHMCECVGPGDNRHTNNGKRVEAGRYPLWTQFGRYRTIGYSQDSHHAGASAMPGLHLEGTDRRIGILIHPGHPPKLYLSSIGCFNPTSPLTSGQSMDFWDSRSRVIALIDSLRAFAPAAFRHETMTHIADASVVVDGEPTSTLVEHVDHDFAMALEAADPASLPISKNAAIQCARWLLENFEAELKAAVRGRPYKVKHLCAIVCQETAYKWLKWTESQTAKTIVERSVFDASGDYPGTTRSAFPKNTAAFRAKYGEAFTAMLIEEANMTRRMQGWSDKPWVYKGYGLFQYDLQHVDADRVFFEQKRWYNFDECLAKCCKELDDKLVASGGDLWDAIRRYNGSGSRAEQYRDNVKAFTGFCATVTGE